MVVLGYCVSCRCRAGVLYDSYSISHAVLFIYVACFSDGNAELVATSAAAATISRHKPLNQRLLTAISRPAPSALRRLPITKQIASRRPVACSVLDAALNGMGGGLMEGTFRLSVEQITSPLRRSAENTVAPWRYRQPG